MKNIHILPTDKPSRLHYFTANKSGYYLYPNNELVVPRNSNCINQNIYITSDEEIKEGGYVFWEGKIYKYRDFMKMRTPVYTDYFSIILTTDQVLIKDGVQAIPNEFMEWLVKNPSCEEVEVEKEKVDLSDFGHYETYYKYKIIIPKEEPKQELHSIDDEVECNNCGNIMSLIEDESIYACYNSECTSCYEEDKEELKQECKGSFKDCFKPLDECVCDNMKKETLEEVAEIGEFAEKKYLERLNNFQKVDFKDGFIEGAKWQQERMYSEEEVKKLLELHSDFIDSKIDYDGINNATTAISNPEWDDEVWFEQFKKK